MIYILLIVTALGIVIAIQYATDIHAEYERLNHYTAKTINTEFGKLSYMDEGSGEAILISHGIFGGYDQGLVSLDGLLGNGHRKVAPSRFGYPGSDLPPDPTPQN